MSNSNSGIVSGRYVKTPSLRRWRGSINVDIIVDYWKWFMEDLCCGFAWCSIHVASNVSTRISNLCIQLRESDIRFIKYMPVQEGGEWCYYRNLAMCPPLSIKNVKHCLDMQIENGNKPLKNADVKTATRKTEVMDPGVLLCADVIWI
jgi:hypothetical protein